jgi:hypothetical protein
MRCLYRDYLGSVDWTDNARDIDIQGDTVYALGRRTLRIIDASDAAHPAVLSEFGYNYGNLGLAVRDDLVFIAATIDGIQVIDASDPTAPVLLANYPYTDDVIRDVDVVGSLAYVVGSDIGLEVLDVSDPLMPVSLGSITHYTYDLRRVRVRGDFAFVVDAYWGLRIFDVSDPRDLRLVGQYQNAGWDDFDIELFESVLFAGLGDMGRVELIDISDPRQPSYIARLDHEGWPQGFHASGERLLVADSGGTLSLFDLSNPAVPEPVGSYRIPFPVGPVRARGSVAFVLGYYGGLQIIDTEDPSGSAHEALYEMSASPRVVLVAGDRMYTAAYGLGVQIHSISDPRNPVLLGSYEATTSVGALALQGEHLLVADLVRGLMVLDVSVPSAMRLESILSDHFSHFTDMIVRDGVAYLANDSTRGLYIADVSDPANPFILGWAPTPEPATGVGVSGATAFLVVPNHGLMAFDVSDLGGPSTIATYPYVGDLAISGQTAVVSGRTTTLLDVSDPAALTVLAEFDGQFLQSYQVSIHGDLVVAGGDFFGESCVFVLDRRVPESLRLVGMHFPPHFNITAIDAAGDLAFAGGGEGIEIIDISDCPPCPADFNNDGTINTQDFIAFLQAWAAERTADCSAGDCLADLDDNGLVDTRDFVEFLNAWAAGC